MAEKVKVKCVSCGGRFKAMSDEIAAVKCPSCGGALSIDEAPHDATAPSIKIEQPVEPTAAKPPEQPPAQKPQFITADGDDVKALEQIGAAHKQIIGELDKVIVGQKAVVEQVLAAILAEGHCLLEGVPGLAKTLLVDSLSKALSLQFKRIQFTPDLMPSDITGTDVIQDDPVSGQRMFKFLPGPIFSNIILADEVNRTPPKTQAAMLEATPKY